MFKRLFNLPLTARESYFIFGPRGTGKTQWLKSHIKQHETVYIDLLNTAVFRQLKSYPEKLKEIIPPQFTGWIIIDEVQKVPELLDEVHRLIEHASLRFILTGSSARKLKREGINLLAGRAIRYTMHPLVIQELNDAFQLEHALLKGMLPATYTYADPAGYLATYVDTYLREEVMYEGLTRNLGAFVRFLEIASFSQGGIINASEIAREVGCDRQVIQHNFRILDDLLLAHTLPVFTKKAKRRLITTEKFYYFDVGIYQQLRPKGILDNASEIGGFALETLFLQSFLAINDYFNLHYKLYYWRTASGVEVDFIAYGETALFAFEIKHAKQVTHKMLRGLQHFKEDYPMAHLFMIYLGQEKRYLDNIIVMPMQEALWQLPALLANASS